MTTEAADGPLLAVEGLSVSYGPVVALHEISLTVAAGEIVTVLGPNGAGKTTLLRTIAGALKPAKGTIAFEGARIAGRPPEEVVRRGICMVPEGRHVFPGLTARENLEVGAIARRDADAIAEDLERIFSMFPILRERGDQPAGTLSGGEQQQLAIGRALMARPRLILLDEPSLGLAPIVVDRIFELIGELRRQGSTLLLVEQNVHRALDVADRAYVLSVGRLVTQGRTDQLAAGELERTYLGLSEAG
jgi:branched-chain amino acid transport system ATP-binding protein